MEPDDDGDEEPVAAWEALLLPNWRWEALEETDEDGLYFGRVRSPNTYGKWEYGYFTESQLKRAGAYRVDTGDEDEPLFPDGGYDRSELFETELTALVRRYNEEVEEVDD